MTEHIEVPADLNGTRADRAVAILCDISRRAARLAIESGGVVRRGIALAGAAKVAEGDVLLVDLAEVQERAIPEASVDFAVVFEDQDLLVVDKPAGVVVHPGAGRPGGTLANGLLARFPEISDLAPEYRWGIVHRIDRDTSGLLIVGKNVETIQHLQAALKRRDIKREYRALVSGRFVSATGTIDAPIGRDPAEPTRMAVVEAGRPARTHYQRLAEWDDADVSFASVSLETGRTHQIRVHMRSIGHPVVGDPVYGRKGSTPGDPGRTWLHAASLTFDHPSGSGPMTVRSDLPEDLVVSLTGLGDPIRGAIA
jgi:23S rRNA pseudouridine1911/1915/1917 synthase